jgi:hypothetical protein
MGHRLDRIGEGRQVVRRLGFTDRHNVRGREPAQRRAPIAPQGIADLGEHVQGVLVSRVVERSVAGRLVLDQPAGRGPLHGAENGPAPVHAEGLGRDRHVGIAVLHQVGVEVGPVGRRLTARDVHPFDHDRAVEIGRIRRAPHQNPGSVTRLRRRSNRPPAVARLRRGLEGVGRPGGEVFLLLVAVGGQTGREGRLGLNDMARRDRAGNRRGGAVDSLADARRPRRRRPDDSPGRSQRTPHNECQEREAPCGPRRARSPSSQTHSVPPCVHLAGPRWRATGITMLAIAGGGPRWPKQARSVR